MEFTVRFFIDASNVSRFKKGEEVYLLSSRVMNSSNQNTITSFHPVEIVMNSADVEFGKRDTVVLAEYADK